MLTGELVTSSETPKEIHDNLLTWELWGLIVDCHFVKEVHFGYLEEGVGSTQHSADLNLEWKTHEGGETLLRLPSTFSLPVSLPFEFSYISDK